MTMSVRSTRGGRTPSNTVPFARPDTGQAEATAAAEVILGGWLTTSSRCHEFEREFAARVGALHAVALNSCTSALHLALEAVGVRPGDLVVTTPYTFATSAEVIRYFDALPVFVDVESSTFNLDVDLLAEKLDRLEAGDQGALPPAWRGRTDARRPAAVLPVHIGGVPCDLDGIYKLAVAHDLPVVEDAAHAFPCAIGERMIGTRTDPSVPSAVCFSFYATKTITTGEGGMLVTDDANVAERARRMSLHGLSHQAWSRYLEGGSWQYDISDPGFKYNLTDIAAAIGLVQLARSDAMTASRSEIARRYDEEFRDVDALEIPTVPAGITPSWHLYMLRIRPEYLRVARDAFIVELKARGVGTSVHFTPLHLHSYYADFLGYRPADLPVSSAEWQREISLPIYSSMTGKDVEHVVHSVIDVVRGFAR